MIEVVSALIVRDGRILLTQRDPRRSDYGWKWETPGGKVDPNESRVEAIKRELGEELGVVAKVDLTWCVVELVAVPKPVRVAFFRVSIGDQVPEAREAIGIGWFTAAEVNVLDLAPANAQRRNAMCKLVAGSR